MNFYIHQEITHKETGEKFTVRLRDLKHGIAFISVWEKPPNEWFESSLFEERELMDSLDKCVDEVFKEIKHLPEFFSECHLNVTVYGATNYTIPQCVVDHMNDKQLINEWRESIDNEEYESSRVFLTEITKRKIKVI